MTDKAMAGRLVAWRRSLGLTQEAFSAMTGLHIGVIRKYENAVNIPGGEALVRIAQTGVNLNWLLLNEGEINRLAVVVAVDRMDEIRKIVDSLDEPQRTVIVDELFSRAQEARRLSELEALVRGLRGLNGEG